MSRRRAALAVLAAIVLTGGTATYGVITADRPQVESVETEWGTVTDERTEVETRIGVDEPLVLRAGDAAADVSYTVSVNDIVLASERDNRVRLDETGRAVTVSTWIDNDEIPAWWASHVNRNETTTVRVEPDVVTTYGGIRLPADGAAQERTVRTDLLEPLRTNQTRRFRAYDRTVLVVDETDAEWGTATENRTPIDASATVTNPTGLPVPITEIGYTVRLNGIVVGEGVAADQTVIPAGSTRTIDAGAAIDNAELDDWWVTHLRNDETSNLTVEFDATLEYAGIRRTVPLEFLSYDRTFRTDLLGSADANEAESASDRDDQRERVRRPN
ncbi:LEA type 2 family protein [Haloterrigena sp. SYSU A121-1]|uniref:LEA type 2 family protein n=1 Tax=Haloterrigena gelatinilytica TaxID=2741724 RepID=A0A8J8GQP1_9EURY|nr:LEA type 2 family protein [Haloterrigena gelatinilytica]NUB92767.1 LEA type 2 family protein [Haloterrigena gelatinilytica]